MVRFSGGGVLFRWGFSIRGRLQRSLRGSFWFGCFGEESWWERGEASIDDCERYFWGLREILTGGSFFLFGGF